MPTSVNEIFHTLAKVTGYTLPVHYGPAKVGETIEREITRSDGSRVPVEVLVHIIKNPQGELQYFYSFINDISERRQAERTVKRTVGAMETSIDGMAIINANGECVYVNHAQARIYGYESPWT